MPFTADQFFAVFARYNTATWPAPIALFGLGLAIGIVTLATRTPHRDRERAIGLALAGVWIWMALVYHWMFFRAINPLAPAFAAIFLAEAVALGWLAVRHPADRLCRTNGVGRTRGIVSAVLLGYALVLYPAVGVLVGQRYPALPSFGLPCPTTLFTLGVLIRSPRRIPWLVYVVPTVWAVIATGAAVLFGVVEDFVLLPAVGLALALNTRWTSRSAPALSA